MRQPIISTMILLGILIVACTSKVTSPPIISQEAAGKADKANMQTRTQSIDTQVEQIQPISLRIPAVSQRIKDFDGDKLYNQCVNISLAMVIMHYGLYEISDSQTPERLALDIRKK